MSVALEWILFKEIAFKKTNGDATVKFLSEIDRYAHLYGHTISAYCMFSNVTHLSMCFGMFKSGEIINSLVILFILKR